MRVLVMKIRNSRKSVCSAHPTELIKTESRSKKLKGQSIPNACTPAQRTGLNTTTGGASGRRVECEYEEDVRIYVNVDDLWNLVAG